MSRLDQQASASSDAVLTTTYADNSTVQSTGFVLKKNFSIGSGITVYFLIDYTTYIPSPGKLGLIYAMPPFFKATDGPVSVVIYRGTNYVAGSTVLHLYNPNTLSDKIESATTVTQGATGSNKGTAVLEYIIGGAGKGSGDDGGGSFFIRPNTGKTLIEVTNSATGTVTFNWFQQLFEI